MRKDGIYPMDLHGGNVMKTIKTGRIVLIDTGQLGRLPVESKDSLMQFLSIVRAGEAQQIIGAIDGMGKPYNGDEIDHDGLEREVRRLLAQKGSDPIEQVRDMVVAAAFGNLKINDPFMDLLKGLMSFQGLATRLDPEFKFMQ